MDRRRQILEGKLPQHVATLPYLLRLHSNFPILKYNLKKKKSKINLHNLKTERITILQISDKFLIFLC